MTEIIPQTRVLQVLWRIKLITPLIINTIENAERNKNVIDSSNATKSRMYISDLRFLRRTLHVL